MTTSPKTLDRFRRFATVNELAVALRGVSLLLAFCTASTVAACGPEYDPLTRSEVWHPDHSNRANLTMQVANPSDLVRGTGTTTSDGMLAAAAVDRLRNDKIKKLPAADISQLSVSQAGANNTAGGQ